MSFVWKKSGWKPSSHPNGRRKEEKNTGVMCPSNMEERRKANHNCGVEGGEAEEREKKGKHVKEYLGMARQRRRPASVVQASVMPCCLR